MPELPEVEHLRRTLLPLVVGARVARVRLWRGDIVRVAGTRRGAVGVRRAHLLAGDVIIDIRRHGKSLALIAQSGRVLGVHLGMTGSMEVRERSGKRAAISRRPSAVSDQPSAISGQRRDPHVHCVWALEWENSPRAKKGVRGARPHPCPLPMGEGVACRTLSFRDPRRFGGLYPFASIDDLRTRAWSRLGPDALTIDAATLRERLRLTTQPIKASLLNQKLIAGVGNIYADEALFAARVHPLARPRRLSAAKWEALACAIRGVLGAAIEAGGSTIRDYRDARGEAGAFIASHQVYGRGGEVCAECDRELMQTTIAQRTTVFCRSCQKR